MTADGTVWMLLLRCLQLQSKPCLKGPDMFAYILLVHLVRLLHSDPLVLTAAKLDAARQNTKFVETVSPQHPEAPFS